MGGRIGPFWNTSKAIVSSPEVTALIEAAKAYPMQVLDRFNETRLQKIGEHLESIITSITKMIWGDVSGMDYYTYGSYGYPSRKKRSHEDLPAKCDMICPWMGDGAKPTPSTMPC